MLCSRAALAGFISRLEALRGINDYEVQRGLGICALRNGFVQFLATVYSVGDQGNEINSRLLFYRGCIAFAVLPYRRENRESAPQNRKSHPTTISRSCETAPLQCGVHVVSYLVQEALLIRSEHLVFFVRLAGK